MNEKRFRLEVEDDMYYTIFDNQSTDEEDKLYGLDDEQICDLLNEQHETITRLKKENEQLKKDVDYWKQVASQYSNELNVFEHCKKYKTECKDIHWSSD